MAEIFHAQVSHTWPIIRAKSFRLWPIA